MKTNIYFLLQPFGDTKSIDIHNWINLARMGKILFINYMLWF